jgi:hypothetical protein
MGVGLRWESLLGRGLRGDGGRKVYPLIFLSYDMSPAYECEV